MSADERPPVSGLPLAGDRAFRSLDEYLAFRAELGAFDSPHYTEVEPGVYELWGGRRPPGVPGSAWSCRSTARSAGSPP